jgi:hypothetical protein
MTQKRKSLFNKKSPVVSSPIKSNSFVEEQKEKVIALKSFCPGRDDEMRRTIPICPGSEGGSRNKLTQSPHFLNKAMKQILNHQDT